VTKQKAETVQSDTVGYNHRSNDPTVGYTIWEKTLASVRHRVNS